MISKLVYTLLLISSIFLVSSCKKASVATVSTKIAKTWYAKKVVEGTVTAYDATSTSNLKTGYANYRLNLSASPSVTLSEFDGNTFTGTYSIPNDKTLTLAGLTPVPTGTGGTISYTINSISDTELVLTTTQTSPKTGNTINIYTLAILN